MDYRTVESFIVTILWPQAERYDHAISSMKKKVTNKYIDLLVVMWCSSFFKLDKQ